MNGSLEVLNGGLYTTIQDEGRFGYRKYGVPVSGVMDERAFELGNWLVGNEEGAPVLEMTLKGGSYRFNTNAVIAVTGAEMSPKVDGREVPLNCSFHIEAGEVLSLGYAERGCRCYLAIRGKLDIEEILGSYSTFTTGNFGGFNGAKLEKGDKLSWIVDPAEFLPKKTPEYQIPYYSSKITFEVYKSREWNWLSSTAKEQFLNTSFEVTAQSNRMGIRLKGGKIQAKKKQMKSSPVVPGIIQLPENGQPIVLMKDGQAVGGYPRIVKIPDSDLWRAGQVKPGDVVRFTIKNRTEYKSIKSE